MNLLFRSPDLKFCVSAQAQDMKSAELVYKSVTCMLQHETGAAFDEQVCSSKNCIEASGSSDLQTDVYELVDALKLPEEGFSWAPGVGNDNFEFVPRGTLIGTRGNQTQVRADFDAYLLFPKLAELFKQGLPFCWLCAKRDHQGSLQAK